MTTSKRATATGSAAARPQAQPASRPNLKDTGCKPQAHGQADPGGGRCPRCERPRCTAAAKTRPGERCRKNPHPGASICTNHGLTQVGREAAAARVAGENAERELQKLWSGLGKVEAVQDPYAAMAELAGSLRALVDEAGLRVDSMKHLAGGEHLTQLRAEVVLFEKVLGRYQATLDALGRLELSGRHLVMQEKNAKVNRDWADLVMLAQHHAWSVLARSVPTLLPEHRAAYLTAFTSKLVDAVPGEVLEQQPLPELGAGAPGVASIEEDA